MNAMQALENSGNYWYFEPGQEPVIVRADPSHHRFAFHGTDEDFVPRDLPGQFIGPITYPPEPSTTDKLAKALRDAYRCLCIAVEYNGKMSNPAALLEPQAEIEAALAEYAAAHPEDEE